MSQTPPRSPTLKALPFERGYELFFSLSMAVSPDKASFVLGHIVDYAHPLFERHMQAVSHLATRDDINPRLDVNPQQLNDQYNTIETLVEMLGVEVHKTFMLYQIFDSNKPRACPYELNSVQQDVLILTELLIPSYR